MTTVVLMSDIHGNMPALQAVADSLPPHDAAFVAGDLCASGPAPDAVVDFIRSHGWTCIMGNTDRDLLTSGEEGSRREQRLAWTRAVLGAERLLWMGSLPFSRSFSDDGECTILIVHANPIDMDTHLEPTMSAEDVQPYLQGVRAEMLAFGHLHIPYVRPVGGVLLLDVASVGHPKDGDRRAAYTVVRLEGDRRSVEQVRIPYDMDETIRLLRDRGFPAADKQVESLLRASY